MRRTRLVCVTGSRLLSFHQPGGARARGKLVSTVLFVWELGEGLGHVVGQRPLALALRSRGHEVVLAVRNVRSAATAFAGTGLRFVQCPYMIWRTVPRFTPLVSYAHMLDSVGFGNPGGLAALISAWRCLMDLVDPDLIVFDHSPTALLAARTHRARRVLAGNGFFAPPPTYPLPRVHPDIDADPDRLRRDEDAVLATVNEAMTATGTETIDELADMYRDVDLNLLMTYGELDHFGPRPDQRYFGVQNECPGVAPTWPSATGPKIYGYLKPAPDLAAVLRALSDTGQPTIIFGTWVNDDARRRFGSATLRLEDRPLDMDLVGTQCDLAILNGTHGTCAELLLHGVPLLQLPIFVEQALTAKNTVRMGAGLMADPRDARAITACLTRMLGSDAYRHAAGQFSARYAGADRAAVLREIADLIERLLGSSS